MKSRVAKLKVPILETLPTSPLSVACPLCKALPMYDCATKLGVFAAVHVARINAAARIDLEKKTGPIMRRKMHGCASVIDGEAEKPSGFKPSVVSELPRAIR
jgi:hypothetical protein